MRLYRGNSLLKWIACLHNGHSGYNPLYISIMEELKMAVLTFSLAQPTTHSQQTVSLPSV
jgi:hypothetical protein